MAYTSRVPEHVVVRIAAAAGADRRTVRKVIAGVQVRGLVRERIDKALREAGMLKQEAGQGPRAA